MRPLRPRARRNSFTVVELLCVVSIIALLAGLFFPSLTSARQRAQSLACSSNLHQIGVAVSLAAVDNDGQYPLIEPDPANPVYPASANAKSLYDTLSPYGITTNTLQCPADRPTAGNPSNFQTHGSSYQWSPLADGETMGNVQLYFRNRIFPVSSARLRLALDFTAVHFGRVNWLYGDGHVTWVHN